MFPITRRRLLAAGTAVVGGGYAGYRLLQGAADADFETWAPERGTWPLPRYDPANTGRNPHASPPREGPTRRVLASADGSETDVRPLVGRSRLVRFGPGLSTAPRDGGGWTSITDAEIQHAGLGPDGRLHAAERTSRAGVAYDLVGYDGTTEAYRASLSEGFPEWVAVGATEVYAGHPVYGGRSPYEVASIDSGGRDWRVSGAKTALADGRLYSASPDGVAAYEERTGLDRRVTPGPKRAWTGPWPPGRGVYEPAVADGRLVIGTYGVSDESGAVAAYDTATGEQLWEPLTLGKIVATPAIEGERGFAAVRGADTAAGRVVALDLASGDVLWNADTDWDAFDPVVGGDTLVVAGDVREDESETGRVRGYDTASGEVLWTETFPGWPDVALVDDRVLVTSGGTLYELA